MAGPNTSGQPNTADYNLGRGIVYLAFLDANAKPQNWRDLGNCPAFKTSINTSTLDHQSSRAGLKVTDKSVVLSQDTTLTISLDEINDENLALFFAGTKNAFTNAAIAGITKRVLITNSNIVLGSWYDIVNSAGARAYDIDSTKLTVEDSTGSPIVFVEDTDYLVDEAMGRIFLLATSTALATAISGTKDINIVLTADSGAGVVTEVRALTQASLTCAVKFIAENPADNNAKVEYEFHQITLKATGDFDLIGDAFTVLQLEGTAEQNNIGYPNSPTLTIRTIEGISDPA